MAVSRNKDRWCGLLARLLLKFSPELLFHLILGGTILAALAQYPVQTSMPPVIGAGMFIAVLLSGIFTAASIARLGPPPRGR